jgi:hypothetical protein
MGWLVKLLFFVMLAPFFVCLAVQLFTAVAMAILPWLIAGAAISGLVAGLSAALVLRRRLPPPRRDTGVLSGGYPRIKRPRGPRDDR